MIRQRDGAELRRERIELATKRVVGWLNESKDGEISLSKAVAELESETGNKPERMIEYLQNGHDRERFILDKENDRIKSIKKKKADSDNA